MNTRRILLFSLGGAVLVAAGIGAYFGFLAPAPPTTAPVAGRAVTGQAPAVTEVDMTMGSPEAPVTIIEYASLTCPHCATFHTQTLPPLKERFIDTGQVRLVYRDFPLDQLALAAAHLPHCAGPERYFGFLSVLYSQQSRWVQAQNPGQALAQIAAQGGMDQAAFDACLSDGDLSQRIADTRYAAEGSINVRSTPTLVVNGEVVAGAITYADLEQRLTSLLPD
jgi:protein-disulfide isomerase